MRRSVSTTRSPGFLGSRLWVLTLIPILIASPADAQTTTLEDALQQALLRHPLSTPIAPPRDPAPRWLAGPPSLAASYLESNFDRGTDETELSLNFPVKSPLQRRSDDSLLQLEPMLREQTRRYREWYLSGILRDLYAEHQEARAALPAAREGARLLGELERQLRIQVAARATERFALLAAGQARLAAEEELAGVIAVAKFAQQRFREITGLQEIPEQSGDTAPLPTAPHYSAHPQLQLLELDLQRTAAALNANSPGAMPWNFALVGRELSIPAFTERQFGVSLQVPLGQPPVSAATRSELLALQRDFLMQRDQLRNQINSAWRKLQSEHRALTARAEQAVSLAGEDLGALLTTTKDSRELPIEIKVARLRSLLQAQAEVALTAARLSATEARLRQVAGQAL